MSAWLKDGQCTLPRAHCPWCVAHPEWRLKAIGQSDCPHGVTAKSLPPEGPGTQLKRLFEQFGIRPKASCRCHALVSQMNSWGEKCEEHLDEIVAQLVANSMNFDWSKFVPFKAHGFRAFVRLAIQRAKG